MSAMEAPVAATVDAGPWPSSPRTPRTTLTKAPAREGETASTVELHDTRFCGVCRPAKILDDWLPARLPSLPGMSAMLVQATYAIFTTIVTMYVSIMSQQAARMNAAEAQHKGVTRETIIWCERNVRGVAALRHALAVQPQGLRAMRAMLGDAGRPRGPHMQAPSWPICLAGRSLCA